MDLVVPQRDSERIELANEMVDGEQRCVGDPVRLAAAELVIAYNRAVAAQRFQRFEIVTGVARTPVEQYYGCSVSASRFPVPDAAARHVEVCLSRVESGGRWSGGPGDRLMGWSLVAGAAGAHADCSDANCYRE